MHLYNQATKAFTIRLKRPLNKLNSLQKESNQDYKLQKQQTLPISMLNKIEKPKTTEIPEETIRSSKLFQESVQLAKKYKKKLIKLKNQVVEKEQENTKLQQQLKQYQTLKRKQLKKILKLLKEKAELQEYITILQNQLHSRFQEDDYDDYADDLDHESQLESENNYDNDYQHHNDNDELQEDTFERTFQLHSIRINQFRDFIQQLQQNQIQLFPMSADFTDFNPDSMNYEQLLELQDRIGYANKGFSEEEINKIPITEYQPNKDLDQNMQFESKIQLNLQSCAICQCSWEQGDKLKILNCHHNYHSQCIDEWLKKNKNCPVCIQEVCL